ncbi:hypothetical protein MRB53_039839 [Persea americana]|nr:hypothetical protein MRB53_039839 [Persea americana]
MVRCSILAARCTGANVLRKISTGTNGNVVIVSTISSMSSVPRHSTSYADSIGDAAISHSTTRLRFIFEFRPAAPHSHPGTLESMKEYEDGLRLDTRLPQLKNHRIGHCCCYAFNIATRRREYTGRDPDESPNSSSMTGAEVTACDRTCPLLSCIRRERYRNRRSERFMNGSTDMPGEVRASLHGVQDLQANGSNEHPDNNRKQSQ